MAFSIAYGVVSLPAAWLLARPRPVRGVIVALGMMIAACLIMRMATNAAAHSGVLFVLASGITILQVAVNPLAAALGRPAPRRIRAAGSSPPRPSASRHLPW